MQANWIVKEGDNMTKKEFTDYFFKIMYELGYKKAEVEKGHIFFYKLPALMTVWVPRIPVELTCFVDNSQCIDIGEYIGVIDWDKVEVDTPIFVKMKNDKVWKCRYFSKYENGKVYAWVDGRTSWSNRVCDEPSCWEIAKLAGDRA
jgi:hypothetical protein